MDEIYTLTVYTQNGAINYQVRASTPNFKDDLLAALERGATIVDTVDGSTLIINPLQATAIEISAYIPPD